MLDLTAPGLVQNYHPKSNRRVSNRKCPLGLRHDFRQKQTAAQVVVMMWCSNIVKWVWAWILALTLPLYRLYFRAISLLLGKPVELFNELSRYCSPPEDQSKGIISNDIVVMKLLSALTFKDIQALINSSFESPLGEKLLLHTESYSPGMFKSVGVRIRQACRGEWYEPCDMILPFEEVFSTNICTASSLFHRMVQYRKLCSRKDHDIAPFLWVLYSLTWSGRWYDIADLLDVERTTFCNKFRECLDCLRSVYFEGHYNGDVRD